MENNLELTIDALASSGVVLSTEQKTALQISLPLKKVEAGLSTISLWGKIAALNGKDYLVAEGKGKAYFYEKKVETEIKFYYSQDCVKWLDLEPVDETSSKRCLTISSALSGDPSAVVTVTEPAPKEPESPGALEAEPEAEAAEEEEEEEKVVEFEFTELQRLQAMVASIKATTAVKPKGAYITTGDNAVILNKAFAGLEYPEKLESYALVDNTVEGKSLDENDFLSDDLAGSWALHYDAFSSTAIIRSLMYPGYVFYYCGETTSWGSLYFGSGIKNTEFIFMT